jgi:hypothetical protein
LPPAPALDARLVQQPVDQRRERIPGTRPAGHPRGVTDAPLNVAVRLSAA